MFVCVAFYVCLVFLLCLFFQLASGFLNSEEGENNPGS
jgi:hypothetical protein